MSLAVRPPHWLYPDYNVLLNLKERRELAKTIFDVGISLKLPILCIWTAIVYIQRFLVKHLPTQYLPKWVCQAALLLACKKAKVKNCPLKFIYERTNAILNIPTSALQEVILSYREKIIQHERILLSTLEFVCDIQHPHAYIAEVIKKRGGSKELENMTYKVAMESILLAPFCIKYSPEVIACFCIQMAAEILNSDPEKKYTIDESWFQVGDKSYTMDQIKNLKDEFYTIWKDYPNEYKYTIFKEQHSLWKLIDKLPSVVNETEEKTQPPHVNLEQKFVPSSSTSRYNSSDNEPSFSETSTPDLNSLISSQQSNGSHQEIGCQIPITTQTSQVVKTNLNITTTSQHINSCSGNKHGLDSSDDDNEVNKRLCTFPTHEQK
ncbi:unnamed protein product [Adineta steineri]|uniref:Cyclin-like domain-containing protein n=1 Tax=Adineta steineri TaxID=433720 RepID=A0A813XFZ6_9BILA|nr:unnamed protein product [Adineta steineri]CAF3609773.1 unnamed protein product [Adineta steineri]